MPIARSAVGSFSEAASNPGQSLTGLDWNGAAPAVRRLYWLDPPAIYDATYLFKVFQRDQVTNRADTSRYCTTFFWSNNGTAAWQGGLQNTYYGAHPYPGLGGAPDGDLAWEASLNSNDYIVTEAGTDPPPEIVYNAWYSQAFIAQRNSSSQTNHRYFLNLPSTAAQWVIDVTVNDSNWAAEDPPEPCISVGQSPPLTGGGASLTSWGGYDGREEQNAIIRGIQIYSSALTQAEVVALGQLDTDAAVLAYCAANSITSLWFLNMNPTPTDVTDKSGAGNHGSWEGAGRPTLWTG